LPAEQLYAQGALTPPGAPAPTMKTLEEIEPRTIINSANTPGDEDSTFKITQPGSYYLAANLLGESGKHGVEVAANSVTIDLMGFTLIGVSGSLNGIFTEATGVQGVTILNGSVTDWAESGIAMSTVADARIEHVTASTNGLSGIHIGQNSVVTNCVAGNNGATGIRGGLGCVITHCAASENATGITGSIGSNIRDCTSSDNETGFSLGRDATISSCTARGNTSIGISVSRECYAVNNNCIGNGSGIKDTFGQNRIVGNHCAQNTIGFEITNDYNYIVRNTATINTTNWSVVAGNAIIVVEAIRDTSGFTGNSGGVSLGSTDPNANYSIFIP